MKNLFAILKTVFLGVAFISIGFILGSIFEKKNMDKMSSMEQTVNTIAIVNMDEGAVVDGEKVNFASSFALLPDDSFQLTSLSEAERGIKEGTYGAYVVFPGNFSTSVESINTNPEKVTITYSINPNLKEETRTEVIVKVKDYLTNVNDDLSKSYVKGIMSEFHNVQDGSVEILKNDKKDLENIMAIKPNELTKNVSFSQMSDAGKRPDDIYLSGYVKSNKDSVANLNSYHSKANENTTNKMDEAKTTANGFSTDFGNLSQKIGNFGETVRNSLTGTSTIDVWDGYSTTQQTYKTNLENSISNELVAQRTTYQNSVNSQLSTIQSANQSKINAYISEEQAILQEWYTNTLLPAVTVASPGSTIPQMPSLGACNLDNAVAGCSNPDSNEVCIFLGEGDITISSTTQTSIETYTNSFGNLDNSIKCAVNAQYRTQLEDIVSDIDDIKNNADAAKTNFKNFDPYANINVTTPDKSLKQLNDNANGMQSEVNKKIAADNEYVSKVCTTTTSNVNTLKTDMRTASDTTQKNVENMTQKLKDERTAINEQNDAILSPFTEKLAYTRVGTLENEQAYMFIVEPVVGNEAIAEKKDNNIKNNNRVVWLIVGIGSIVLYAVSQIVSSAVLSKE